MRKLSQGYPVMASSYLLRTPIVFSCHIFCITNTMKLIAMDADKPKTVYNFKGTLNMNNFNHCYLVQT